MKEAVSFSLHALQAPRILLAGHARFIPDRRFNSERKQECELCLISSGSVNAEINGVPFVFEGGCVFTFEPGDVLSGRGDPSHGMYSCRWARFSLPPLPPGKSAHPLPRLHKLAPASFREFQSVFDALLEAFSAGWEGWELAAGGYLQALVAILAREAARGGAATNALDRRLLMAAAFLERNLSRNIKIAEAAEHVRMSEGYFVRMFHRRFAMPPLQYLMRLRLKEARRLLATDPRVSIAEAAVRAGFGNSKYFATVFKAHYNLPPSAFRNSLVWRGPG